VKVTSPNTGVTLYLYDQAGNLVAKQEDFAGTPRTTLYEYDGLDRLTRVDFPSDPDWIFGYDASAALNQARQVPPLHGELQFHERPMAGRSDRSMAAGYGKGRGVRPLSQLDRRKCRAGPC
jgi:hypothetical protein